MQRWHIYMAELYEYNHKIIDLHKCLTAELKTDIWQVKWVLENIGNNKAAGIDKISTNIAASCHCNF